MFKECLCYIFFPHTARLWNFLLIKWFPLSYGLNGFESRINRHLLTVDSCKSLQDSEKVTTCSNFNSKEDSSHSFWSLSNKISSKIECFRMSRNQRFSLSPIIGRGWGGWHVVRTIFISMNLVYIHEL